MDYASTLLDEGTKAISATASTFDLSAVAEVDSSGLAVLFGWLRAARAQGLALKFVNPPRNLLSLAQVYGVSDLLPVS